MARISNWASAHTVLQVYQDRLPRKVPARSGGAADAETAPTAPQCTGASWWTSCWKSTGSSRWRQAPMPCGRRASGTHCLRGDGLAVHRCSNPEDVARGTQCRSCGRSTIALLREVHGREHLQATSRTFSDVELSHFLSLSQANPVLQRPLGQVSETTAVSALKGPSQREASELDARPERDLGPCLESLKRV